MLNNNLMVNGRELLYSPRTLSYLKHYYPYIEVKCVDESPNVSGALEPGGFDTPEADNAPWMIPDSSGATSFLGGVINDINGLYDSTQVGNSTELKDYGAVHHKPHFSAREVRVKATLYARTQLGLNFGMDWLKNAIDDSFCGTGFGANCSGSSLEFFSRDSTASSSLQQILDVKVLQGVKVLEHVKHHEVQAVAVEFILLAGSPFVYNMEKSWTVDASNGTSATSVPEVDCDPIVDAYSELITDPLDGSVVRPPRPPAINPLPMPGTWTYRSTTSVPESITDNWAQAVLHVKVSAAETRRQIRLRVYRDSSAPGGCGYVGELYFTYIPAGATLHVDGRTREIYIIKSGQTRRIPASNLVLGSAGRPLKWPVIDCRTSHRIELDVMGALSGLTVTVDAYLRR